MKLMWTKHFRIGIKIWYTLSIWFSLENSWTMILTSKFMNHTPLYLKFKILIYKGRAYTILPQFFVGNTNVCQIHYIVDAKFV